MTNALRLRLKHLYRTPMLWRIRDLVRWEPIADPADGYTVLIGCMESLAPVAVANLRLCERQASRQLREIVLVFDCPPDRIPAAVRAAAADLAPAVPVRLLGYDERQYRTAKRYDWGWVYCWLSWVIGIAAVRTRAVLVHDLDALPVGPGLFDQLYRHWQEAGAEFCGIRPYVGNGITREMAIPATFEMVMDAAHVRRAFRPFDLYNRLDTADGRLINFDTMLHAQWRSPGRAIRPIDEDQLVHPSQLICHHVDLVSGRSDFRGRPHMLPVLAYYMHLGGEPGPLAEAGPGLAGGGPAVTLFGKRAYVDGVPADMWAWTEKQVRRVEQACFGGTRPEVEEFLVGVVRRAGDRRTVGRETGTAAVAAR